MIAKELYPTLPKYTGKMYHGFKSKPDMSSFVLDPQAGKCDILDEVKRLIKLHYGGYKEQEPSLYAIEIEQELQAIIRSKGYPLVGSDFLQYVPLLRFSHIISNPPFSDAEDHFLHAWNMLYDGEMAIILPATILEGKTAKEQMVKQICTDWGRVENIGKAFASAERRTQVECVIVWLEKKPDSKIDLDFDVYNTRTNPEIKTETAEVAPFGFAENLFANFDAAVGLYADYLEARLKLENYVGAFENSYAYHVSDIIKNADAPELKTATDRYNTFVSLLQNAAWDKILNHPKFQSILTERARKLVGEFQTTQRKVDFNRQNVFSMFEELQGKQGELLQAAVDDVFKTMTEYHKENRVYFEGWKSNDCWKVNKRVVLPYYVTYEWGSFHVNYHRRNELVDIDRALCVVSGKQFDSIVTIEQALETAFRSKTGKETESEWFQIRFYQKGTLHLVFKDLELLEKFNMLAARGRNWLPPESQT